MNFVAGIVNVTLRPFEAGPLCGGRCSTVPVGLMRRWTGEEEEEAFDSFSRQMAL